MSEIREYSGVTNDGQVESSGGDVRQQRGRRRRHHGDPPPDSGAHGCGGDGSAEPGRQFGWQAEPETLAVRLLLRTCLPQFGHRDEGPASMGEQQRALLGEGDPTGEGRS
ncbi:hypothetical protein [Streptomyces werraensis]|uniref:hypothetical protein n=1 Tax=Streptomyces werraensis TaxID=68284 RepID=UPI0036CEE72D